MIKQLVPKFLTLCWISRWGATAREDILSGKGPALAKVDATHMKPAVSVCLCMSLSILYGRLWGLAAFAVWGQARVPGADESPVPGVRVKRFSFAKNEQLPNTVEKC